MRPSFVALRQHNFRLWAAANLISVTGTWMQVLGMNWLVLSATGSPTRMGIAVLLQAVPVLVLGPFGGALADRLPARPTLVATQAMYVLLAVALTVTSSTGFGGLGAIYVITLLSGVVAALDGPAMGRFGSTVVAPEHLGNALALGSMVNSAGRIVGMSLGGVLVAVLGPAPLFLARAISIAPIVAALFAMRTSALAELVPPKVSENAFKAVRAGVRFVRSEPRVRIAFGLAFVLGSLGRNYQVTMGAMVAGPLQSGAGGYGALSTAFAVGGVIGGLIAASRRDLSYRFLAGIGLAGSVLQAVSGIVPSMWSFGAMMIMIAATAVIIDTVVATRVQLDTRGDMRGRMLALLAVTGSLAGAVGAPLLGWMSEALGARACLVIAGVVCAVACAGAAAALKRAPQLRPLPAVVPTAGPTALPTAGPAVVSTALPTAGPAIVPTALPTAGPAMVSTALPTAGPAVVPTALPTAGPAVVPTALPAAGPAVVPTALPAAGPVVVPAAGAAAVPPVPAAAKVAVAA